MGMTRVVGASVLAVALACAPRPSSTLEKAELHGSSTVKYALRNPAFKWRTYARPGLHLHVDEGSHTAQHAAQLADSALRARDHVLRLLEAREDSATLEIFLVDTRDDMKRVAGQSWAGWAQTGEKTAFFVAGKGYRPAFRHELMHAYSLLMWGVPPTGPWITEGLGTWATGDCQGKSFDALAAGFMKSDSLYTLPVLIERFRELPEVRGYLQAASIVETIHRAEGIDGVRRRWQNASLTGDGEHPLGPGGDAIEAQWLARLAATTPAFLDTIALRRDGC
jgi:hypothetical protein